MVSQFNVFLTICFFASNFKENPHTTESTPIENKFPFAPWPSVDPEREFAAGNLDGIPNRPSGAKQLNFSVLRWCLVAHPCFHETIVITVPLGHGGL